MNKLLAALLLSPLAAGAAFAASVLIVSALSNLKITFPLLAGAAAYCALHFYPFGLATSFGPKARLQRARRWQGCFYVLAHELSHALAALLSGVRVKKIAVKKTGGFVMMNATSPFISLAPYFIPFYALAAGLLYGLTSFFLDMTPYRPFFTALAGFFLAFHLLNTLDILAGPAQSDLKKAGGVFFSFALVTLLNSLCLVLILKFIFPGLISLKAYAARAWADTATLLRWALAAMSYFFRALS
ncbi:MAG: hypothetical protein HY796_12125 [Elusimicrobia bacterium]|nr:hypothetical protein [Elusimicrobiota bacterium]